MPPELRIGIDTGGTFTDFVVYDPVQGTVQAFKLPSSPHDPAEAVLAGLRRIRDAQPDHQIEIVHGTTVATNALLEGRGARTALVTTAGFRDLLAIGRQNRPELYDLHPQIPPPLVPAALRFEAAERVDASGRPLVALEDEMVQDLVTLLEEDGGVESVAVCLLFSFLYPDHERRIAALLRSAGFFVSASHEILPEFREYERLATTVANAAVIPILDRYLGRIQSALGAEFSHPPRLAVMQSNGGTISPDQARREAVRCILSGPAGGLIAAHQLPAGGGESQRNLLAFDMGGTSTDVSLIAGSPQVTVETEIAGLPVRIPVLDIHTIGAGGGSIARLDPGGGLRVGPESAGADPGPACYGRDPARLLPTVTDANLVLGRLLPERFLGGQMPLYPDHARTAIASLAAPLGISVEAAAAGILAIANAHMVRALRVISVERGHDPAEFSLVSFGGAGGLHAVDLARALGIPRVIVPGLAATFSALGMLQADVVKDAVQTVMLPGGTGLADLRRGFAALEAGARRELAEAGVPAEQVRTAAWLDVRYRGQSYELTVPFSDGWRSAFEDLYRAGYGFVPEGEDVEIVNLRLQARGPVARPSIGEAAPAGPDPSAAQLGERAVWQEDSFIDTPVYDGDLLRAGNRVNGPAVIARADTTIWLPPGSRSEVDGYGSLYIDVWF